jgi:thiamine pyrophosphokinase
LGDDGSDEVVVAVVVGDVDSVTDAEGTRSA